MTSLTCSLLCRNDHFRSSDVYPLSMPYRGCPCDAACVGWLKFYWNHYTVQ